MSRLTPEQVFERDQREREYAEGVADQHIERVQELAGRARVIAAAASIVVIRVLFVGEAVACPSRRAPSAVTVWGRLSFPPARITRSADRR